MSRAHPSRIGKYRIDGELGRGATGTVYLARDGFTGDAVALKIAHAELLDDEKEGVRYRHFLKTEASLVGRLRHPHIVALLDADLESERPYVAMEYVDGEALDRYTTADALLPVSEVFDIAFKCCNALDYAQRLGLVHRDLKPANLLRPKAGGIKLTDFGAAMSIHAQHTQLHGLVGSPAYMSPEQVREAPLTHQSDMFSLGVVLYQLLTGALPFEGDTDFATVYKINYEDPIRPTIRRPDLPEAVDAVLLKALAKKVEHRYATWVDFAEDLAGLCQHVSKATRELDDSRLFRALRQMRFFKDFPDPTLWEALRLGRWCRVQRGEQLTREGALGDSFYMLVEGEVSVERKGCELARISAGVTLGEMIYLRPEQTRRSATITALTDLIVLKIQSETLRAASDNLRSYFDQAFIKLLVERLDEAGRQLSEFDLA
ncbi:MAG: protein kinase [Burkholderiales bacterium]|nr:protein kinase [Burkholderiales bacterium]